MSINRQCPYPHIWYSTEKTINSDHINVLRNRAVICATVYFCPIIVPYHPLTIRPFTQFYIMENNQNTIFCYLNIDL